ncbi:MATE family efflux transporter [Haliovirga abyssi]|uniref:Multidrug export protein MepA n=1 Tax=Haliovirga abyssi TaxID=2996794 RepID=A0AAU9D1U4_9FUSO|nr:MATE family efflux transporter [Haliovirga abyssi]BDU49954.1 MATE family efflux transporter [Haliovirga abyssi]
MNKRKEMLAKENIGKLLFKLSMPATIGMIVQALYNVVDTIFVGRGVGTLGIGALTIAFPIQMLIMAIAQTFGIGGASMISRALGAHEDEKAENIFGTMISSLVIISVVITGVGLLFINDILKIFGATTTILPYARDYIGVIFVGVIFSNFAMSVNNIVRSEGNAKVAMKSMLISAIMNTILDPIFIFGFHMGVKGAAIATVLSQIFVVIYLIYYFYSGKSMLRIDLKHFRVKFDILKEMVSVGVASFARQVAGSVMAIILNNELGFYGGDTSIAAFGIVNRFMMFVFMPMFGVVQGVQPIVGFNYGSKDYTRVKNVLRLAIKVVTLFSIVGFLVSQLFSVQISSIFTKDIDLINSSAFAVKIIVIAFPLIGFQIIGGGFFQSIGKAKPALFLALSRQVLFLIPLVIVLPMFFKLNGVWISFPLADTMGFIVTFFMYKREIKVMTKLEKIKI